MEDPAENAAKKVMHLLSTGGVVERSFFQNVGKIVNKTVDLEIYKTSEDAMRRIEEVISGRKLKRN
mgnify:CR=1 FL=1